jgi:hypothetical protein
MAEENDPVQPQGDGGESQPDTDWKAEARKWEKRSKENAEKAKAYDELQEQSKTEPSSAPRTRGFRSSHAPTLTL